MIKRNKMKHQRLSNAYLRSIFFFTLLICNIQSFGQIIWSSTTGSIWLRGSNWAGGVVPGGTDIAQFNANPTSASTGVGINMDSCSGSASVGAIYVSPSRSNSLIIGNSGTSSGTLNLLGTTLGGFSNVILSNQNNATSGILTLQQNQGTGSGGLSIDLGSSNKTIVTKAGTTTALGTTININTSIAGSGGITFYGSGTWNNATATGNNGGVLRLGGNNSFTGGITVGNNDGTLTGQLQLDNKLAIANIVGNDIIINNNSQLYLSASYSSSDSTYQASNYTLYLNGIGQNTTTLGKGALVNLNNNSYNWDGNINLLTDAGISCLGSNSILNILGNLTGAGQLIKYGNGTLLLSGNSNSYTGGTKIINGTLQVAATSNLPTGDVVFAQLNNNSNRLVFNNPNQTITSLSNTWTNTSSTYSQILQLNNTTLTINQNINTTFGNGAVNSLSAYITGTGTIIKNGIGNLTLFSSAHSFSGSLILNDGTLTLNTPNSTTTNLGNARIVLNKGNLNTVGIGANAVINLNSLTLNDSSFIYLDSTKSSQLKFAASDTCIWTASKQLLIYNWKGTYGSAGNRGRVFVGTSTSGLTATQLNQIRFIDNFGNIFTAMQLSTGEIVPNKPTITTTAAPYGPFCSNLSNDISVDFTYSGPLTGPFLVQLSGPTGTFATDFTTNIIGSGTTSPINATIPVGYATGTGYRVRVINASPVNTFGTNNGINITINGNPNVAAIIGPGFVPQGISTTYTNSTTGGIWNSSNTSVATVSASGVVSGLTLGTTTLSYTVTNSCGLSTTVTKVIDVTVLPFISSVSPTIANAGTTMTINGGNFNGIATNNRVFIGNIRAEVLSGSASSLQISWPLNTAYGTLSVSDSATSLTAYTPFNMQPDYDNTGLITDSFNIKDAVYFTCGSLPVGVATGDLDNDGKPEIVVANSETNTLSVFRNTTTTNNISSTSFAAPISLTTGFGPYYVKIADIDADGKQDIIVTNASTSVNKISVYKNNSTVGSLSFGSKVDYNSGGLVPTDVAVADIDKDGKPDIITTLRGSAKIAVLRNITNVGVINTSSFSSAVTYNTGLAPFKLAVGDVDNDGKIDIAVSNYSSDNVTIFHNNAIPGIIASSSLDAGTTYTTGVGPTGISIADINADGKPEIITTNTASNTISVFQNTNSISGTTSFSSKIDFATGNLPEDLDVADMDGDGKIDIVVGNYFGSSFSIFRNTITGSSITSSSLTRRLNKTGSIYPSGISCRDMDSDGKPDVVLLNGGINTVGIYKNYPLPPVGNITGADTICAGSSSTFANSVTGGYWAVNNPAVATINSSTGVLHALSSGNITISYSTTAQGDTNYSTKMVHIDTTTTVSDITSASHSLCVGASLILHNTASGGVWTSSSPSIATISISGLVTGNNVGTSIITYSINNLCSSSFDTFHVQVTPTSGYEIGNIEGIHNLCTGRTITLSDTSAGGRWTISDTTIANISNSGELTTLSRGTAIVTYTIDGTCGSYLDTFAINVDTLINADSIGGINSVCVGSSITLSSTLYTGGNWTTQTGNSTITPSGVLSGVFAGSDTVYYVISNICNADTLKKQINVLPLADAGIISGPDVLCTGSSTTLTSTTAGGLWTRTNTALNINLLGVANGVSSGIDTIYYIFTNTCGRDSTEKIITVLSAPSAGSLSGASTLCLGSTTTLRASVAGGSWSALRDKITVTDSVVTAVSVGIDSVLYTVSNTCGTNVAIRKITVVTNPTVDTIIGANEVCVGSKITLYDSTAGGTWSKVGSKLSITSAGIVTGISAGIDTVKYTVSNACGSISTSKAITVLGNASTATITCRTTLCEGDTTLVSASIPGGTWSIVSNKLSINSNIISAITPGSDSVVYTISNSCDTATIYKKITINPLPDAGNITGEDTVAPGNHIQLTDSSADGKWYSISKNATVNADGLVTGVKPGQDTIIYVVSNTCGKDTAYHDIIISSAAPETVSNIKVYPNPSTGNFSVKVESSIDQTVQLLFTNSAFQIIDYWTITTNKEYDISINVPSGVYLLSAISLQGWYTSKISVQH